MYKDLRIDQLTLNDVLARDRTALANERTLLAYWRTAFAFAAGGATLLHLPSQEAWMLPAAIGLGVFSVLTFGVGTVRCWQVRKHLKQIAASSEQT